jgi:2'-5' RNA ligase
MRGVGFSLWIVPQGEARRRLAALIAELARRFGGPVFDPHVTLLAGLPGPAANVIARAEDVMRGAKTFPIRFAGPEKGDGYFRCLYVRVEPSPPLLALHAAARDAFGRTEEPPFFPHLSLMYGAPPPPVVIEEVRLAVPDGFEARTVDLYSTEGEVECWRRVRRFRLG